MRHTYFISGATGNVGSKLVATILEIEPKASMILLVRAKSRAEARRRVTSTLDVVAPHLDHKCIAQRVEVCCGDITETNLGLTENEHSSIARRVTHIVHCAASVKFNLELSESLRINVGGTRHMLAFARAAYANGCFRRFCHVSTAFVGRSHGGLIREELADRPAGNANPYERSKHAAECLVIAAAVSMPVSVVRPSIVVGDAQTGAIMQFNVMYAPLRLIAAGLLPVVPCRRRAPLDIVPADYVAMAIHRLCRLEDVVSGTIFNLTAGAERCLSVAEIVRQAVEYFKGRSVLSQHARVRLLPHSIMRIAALLKLGVDRASRQLIDAYRPYLNNRFVFDDTNTRAALGDDLKPPHLRRYLTTLLAYSLETNWGKRGRIWHRAA